MFGMNNISALISQAGATAAALSSRDREVLSEVGAINVNHLRLMGETDPMGMRIALRAAGFDVPRGAKRVKTRCIPVYVRAKDGSGSIVELVRPVGGTLGVDFLSHFEVVKTGSIKTISNRGKVL